MKHLKRLICRLRGHRLVAPQGYRKFTFRYCTRCGVDRYII